MFRNIFSLGVAPVNTFFGSFVRRCVWSCFIWACTYQQSKHNMSNTFFWPLLLPLRGFFSLPFLFLSFKLDFFPVISLKRTNNIESNTLPHNTLKLSEFRIPFGKLDSLFLNYLVVYGEREREKTNADAGFFTCIV